MKKFFLTVLLLSAALAANAQDLVRVGTLKFVHYGAVWYMEKLAPKYNLRISYTVYPVGVDVVKGVAKGEVDMGSTEMTGTIKARNNGDPLLIIGGFSKGGVNIIGRTALGLKSISQLKGHKVGVVKGSTHELVLFATLDKYNLTYSEQPGKDVQIVYASSYPALSSALLTKNVDAACQSEPQASQAISRGYGTSIRLPYDTPLGEPGRAIIATEKFYNSDVALRAMRCFVEATETFIRQPDLAESFIIKTLFGGFITSDEYREAIANAPFTTDMTTGHVQTAIDLMSKYGLIQLDPKKPLKAKAFVREELLEKAKHKTTK
jgi:NitT/TauT family transport system substrate-binding protein